LPDNTFAGQYYNDNNSYFGECTSTRYWLTIVNIQPYNDGIYSCVAKYSGTNVEDDILLHVKG